jgi:hypothetical protein
VLSQTGMVVLRRRVDLTVMSLLLELYIAHGEASVDVTLYIGNGPGQSNLQIRPKSCVIIHFIGRTGDWSYFV